MTTDCGPVMLTRVARFFQKKVMFLLKIMLIYDKPLLSGQTPLNGHLPVPRGYIHTYIRLLTTSPKGIFSANYKEKDKKKNIYKLFKVTIANH